MPKIKKDFSAEELEACLLTLDGEETTAQQVLLRDLCPCRSRCYDHTVWLAICRAFYSPRKEVQHQAEHAIETLLERAKTDERSRELRDWLLEKNAFELSLGRLETPRKKSREARKQEEKVTSQDMPRLLDILEGDQPEDKQKVLRLLCPCRNPHYNKEVWKTVFQTAETGEDGHVRDQAQHAIGTLRKRARTDPRSQDRCCNWRKKVWYSRDFRTSFRSGTRGDVPAWTVSTSRATNPTLAPRKTALAAEDRAARVVTATGRKAVWFAVVSVYILPHLLHRGSRVPDVASDSLKSCR